MFDIRVVIVLTSLISDELEDLVLTFTWDGSI
jgi:hypothetical protein